MTELERTSTLDGDLSLLDEMVGESTLPQRDWEALIRVYNQNNSKFPISPVECAKIIKEVRDGWIPKMVFKLRGLSFIKFLHRRDKNKSEIESLLSKSELSDEEWTRIARLSQDPHCILIADIERASAHHFTEALDHFRKISSMKPDNWLQYMKEVHKEEFEQKEEKKEAQVVIHISPGLLESI